MRERLTIIPPDHAALTARISDRAWNPLQVGMVLGMLLLLYFLASFVGLVFYEEQIPLVRLVITFMIYAAVMILITGINRKRGDSWSGGFGMGLRQLKTLALAPLVYLAALPLLLLASNISLLLLKHLFGIDPELQDVAKIFAGAPSVLKVLYTVMAIGAAPLYEEIMFRGLVFPYFVKHTSLAQGTLLVSILFAVMHFHLPSFAPLLLLSAVLCLAYWRTGSLWVSIGVHVIFNAVSIFMLNSAGAP